MDKGVLITVNKNEDPGSGDAAPAVYEPPPAEVAYDPPPTPEPFVEEIGSGSGGPFPIVEEIGSGSGGPLPTGEDFVLGGPFPIGEESGSGGSLPTGEDFGPEGPFPIGEDFGPEGPFPIGEESGSGGPLPSVFVPPSEQLEFIRGDDKDSKKDAIFNLAGQDGGLGGLVSTLAEDELNDLIVEFQ
ncbi:hypothetical protein N9W43_08215, partial [Litoricolaceae bacterium]|nr:hypothetical protein [Litorivicinaceae bacterium]